MTILATQVRFSKIPDFALLQPYVKLGTHKIGTCTEGSAFFFKS